MRNNRRMEVKRLVMSLTQQIIRGKRIEEDPKQFETIPNPLNLKNDNQISSLIKLRLEIVKRCLENGFYYEGYRTQQDIHFLIKKLDPKKR